MRWSESSVAIRQQQILHASCDCPVSLTKNMIKISTCRLVVESMQTYHLRDFKVPIDSHDAPRHRNEEIARRDRASGTALSQSEHDWAYAKRALARGDDPDLVTQRIADYRSDDKPDPNYYARHTVIKAQAELVRQSGVERPAEGDRTQGKKIDFDH